MPGATEPGPKRLGTGTSVTAPWFSGQMGGVTRDGAARGTEVRQDAFASGWGVFPWDSDVFTCGPGVFALGPGTFAFG